MDVEFHTNTFNQIVSPTGRILYMRFGKAIIYRAMPSEDGGAIRFIKIFKKVGDIFYLDKEGKYY